MPPTLRKISRLTSADRSLLGHAFLLHGVIAILCRRVSYGRLDRWLQAMYRLRAVQNRQAESERVSWAVRTAARGWPGGATCLTEALTARALLRVRGSDVSLRFGVARDPNARLDAHAWLERDGQPIPGSMKDSYAALTKTRTTG
jgi:hypothetical protein